MCFYFFYFQNEELAHNLKQLIQALIFFTYNTLKAAWVCRGLPIFQGLYAAVSWMCVTSLAVNFMSWCRYCMRAYHNAIELDDPPFAVSTYVLLTRYYVRSTNRLS